MKSFEAFRRELSRSSTSGVELAPARPEEVALLIELVRQPKLERGLSLPPPTSAQEQLRRALGQAEHVVLAIKPAGQAESEPVGVLWCHERALRDGWDCYVNEIVLDSGWRQRGVGAALLQTVAELARSAGASRLGLDQMVDNPAVGRLYTRLGLQVVGHDLRCAAPFCWQGELPGALEIRCGSELELNVVARWLAGKGALDSLDQPELDAAAIEAQLSHSLAREAGVLRLAFSRGAPSALCWYEPRTSKAGEPILVFRALAAQPAAGHAARDDAPELRALLACCAGDAAALAARSAYATVWGAPESAAFQLLSELGFGIARLKWRRSS